MFNEALKHGFVRVDRLRMIVVGQDGAGKSSFVDSLLNRQFEKNKASTEGAAIVMAHTSADGWVPKDGKEHLDFLMAQGCSERSHSEHEKIAESDPPSFGSDVRSTASTESLQSDLKKLETETKTLTANQKLIMKSYFAERQKEGDHSNQSRKVRDIWDLGGQEVFLSTHSALMPDNEKFGLSIYVIVMDVSKALSEKAVSFHRSANGKVTDLTDDLGWIRLNGDFPLYWLGTIKAAYDETKQGNHWLGKDEGVDSPPVFVIGSHRDVLNDSRRFPDLAAVEEWLQKQANLFDEVIKEVDLSENGLESRIVLPQADGDLVKGVNFVKKIFLVDNSVSGQSESQCRTVRKIRKLVDLMSAAYNSKMEKMPLFWAYLEKLLFLWEKSMKTVVAKIEEIAQLAIVCNISKLDEVLEALKYLANVGAILYYPNVDGLREIVYTNPTWVVKALSAFVGAEWHVPNMMTPWKRLKEKGVLSNDLFDRRFEQIRRQVDGQADASGDAERVKFEKEHWKRLLTHLDVIAPSAAPGEFFVPSMISPETLKSPNQLDDNPGVSCYPGALVIVPTNVKFVPECLFFRLVTRFLRLYPNRPKLFRHRCFFRVQDSNPSVEGNTHGYMIYLI